MASMSSSSAMAASAVRRPAASSPARSPDHAKPVMAGSVSVNGSNVGRLSER